MGVHEGKLPEYTTASQQSKVVNDGYVPYVEGLNTRKSWEFYERATKVIPGGASSHARCWSYFGVPYALNFVKGRGSKIWDADGNEYIDFCMAMGPDILGHGHPAVFDAIREQLDRGLTMYVGTDELEIKLAEKIMRMCPHVDMLRFSNSGTEATLHAMRFARSYTGRSKVIKFEGHYHGWHDYAMLSNLGAHPSGPEAAPYNIPSTWGIPDETMKTMIVLPWNNLEVLEKTIRSRAGEIAAVITEPIMMNVGCIPPREGYLKAMQELCEENGIVFILDEVISGFRLAPGGAAEYYGLQPDLVTYAKALGAGVPVSAIGGKKKIMKDVVPGKILHAGTYDGNPLVMAAALAALNSLSANDNAAYKHLNKLARMLKDGLDDTVTRLHAPAMYQSVGAVGGQLYFTKLKGINDYREYFQVDTSIFPRYHKELMKRGIYLHPLQSEHEFISAVHTEQDIEKHVAASTEALKVML